MRIFCVATLWPKLPLFHTRKFFAQCTTCWKCFIVANNANSSSPSVNFADKLLKQSTAKIFFAFVSFDPRYAWTVCLFSYVMRIWRFKPPIPSSHVTVMEHVLSLDLPPYQREGCCFYSFASPSLHLLFFFCFRKSALFLTGSSARLTSNLTRIRPGT